MTLQMVRLGDVAHIRGGKTPKALDRYLQANPRSDRDVPFYKVGDLGDTWRLTTARTKLSEAELQRLGVESAPAGTLVFPKAGGAIATNKKRIIDRPGPVDLNCMTVKPGPAIDPWFLLYWFSSFDLTSISDGSVLPQISARRVADLSVPVPSIERQRRIVEILEEHLSHLDAAGADLARARARLASITESALRANLPNAVAMRPLRSLLDVPLSNGRSVPTREGGFPVLRLTALKAGGVDLAERKGGAWGRADAERFLVNRGDFLIARGNGSLRLVGRGSLVRVEPDPVAFPDTAIRARPRPSDMSFEFLELVWNSRATRDQIERVARTSAGIYKVNQSQLEAALLPVPPLAEQERIVQVVEGIRDQSRSALASIHLLEQRSAVLRRSVLASAFEGKLTGRHTDTEVIEELADGA